MRNLRKAEIRGSGIARWAIRRSIRVPHLKRWSPDRALEQVADPVLQDPVGRQPDCVTDALGFDGLVNLGIGEGRVAAKIEPLDGASVADDHRLQHRAPTIGTMNVSGSQRASLNIAELVDTNSG